MCGIIGYSGKDNYNKEILQSLIYINSAERKSTDSTGVYTPVNHIVKNTKTAKDFLVSDFKGILPDNFFMGHVRNGTVGVNNPDNAHPFHEGNVILVHNGTLNNHIALANERKIDTVKMYVDSHYLTGCINHDKNFKVLGEIKGAAALLITITNHPNILYVYRNVERPLYRASDANGNMYISSEKIALEMNNLTKIKEFKENTLYKICEGQIIKTSMIVRKHEPEQTKVGHWVKFTHNLEWKTGVYQIKNDKFYFIYKEAPPITGVANYAYASQTKRYCVKGDDGHEVVVYESGIAITLPKLTDKDNKCISTVDLRLDNQVVIKAGEILDLVKIGYENKTKYVYCKNQNSDIEHHALYSWFRTLTPSEASSTIIFTKDDQLPTNDEDTDETSDSDLERMYNQNFDDSYIGHDFTNTEKINTDSGSQTDIVTVEEVEVIEELSEQDVIQLSNIIESQIRDLSMSTNIILDESDIPINSSNMIISINESTIALLRKLKSALAI